MSVEVVGKVCKKCGVFKPLSEFTKSKTQAKDGRTYRCNQCVREYARKKYAEDPSRREKWAKYHQDHKRPFTEEELAHKREYSKEWRKKNPDKKKAYSDKWFSEHPDKAKEYRQHQYSKPKIDPGDSKLCQKCKQEKPISEFRRNKCARDGRQVWCKECQNAYHREKYKSDKKFRERKLSRVKAWGSTHLENVRASGRKAASKWSKNHPDEVRRYGTNRRAKIIGNGGYHSIQEWKDICEKYDNRCLCCGEKVKLTEDHIIPLDKGGTDNIDNIQPLCLPCNSRKKVKTIDYRGSYIKRKKDNGKQARNKGEKGG